MTDPLMQPREKKMQNSKFCEATEAQIAHRAHSVSIYFAMTSLIIATAMGPVEAAQPSTDIVVQRIAAECTTKETGSDGVRHGCYSKWTKLTAPAGYVINKEKSAVRMVSMSGSEYDCHQSFDGDVEVIKDTDLYQPTITQIRAKARSPKGYLSGRGWAKCVAEVTFTKVP